MAYTSWMADQLCQEEDIVYFTGDTSSHSWAGVIGDENDMTDDAVNEYIKNAKPELFDKLRGMKFGSSDVPLTLKPLRDLRRLDSMNLQANHRTRASPRTELPLDRLIPLTNRESRPASQEYASYNSETPRIEERLQNGHVDDLSQVQNQLKLDGVGQQTVLEAAERLYPKITPTEGAPASFRDKNFKHDNAFKYPPNSKQALDIRALRQLEINETLAEVSKYERALKAAKSQLQRLNTGCPSPDASVLITRQPYMEPRADRYKKQGLTPYDRVKAKQTLLRKNAPTSSASPPSFQRPVQDDSSRKVLYCYCREPEDFREMVRCSKKWCPVGWFHLDCTGLDRIPYLNEDFHCCYCSDGLGPLITHEILDGQRYGRDSITDDLADSVAHRYLHNEIETEFVYEEPNDEQTKTNVPGRHSIYEDEDDDSKITDDEAQLAREHARLHDKIVKWRAVNDSFQRRGMESTTAVPINDRIHGAVPVTSFFKSDGRDGRTNDHKEQNLVGDNSTTQVTSPAVAVAGPTKNIDVAVDDEDDADFYEQEDVDYYEQDSMAEDVPETATFVSAGTYNSENLNKNLESASSGHPSKVPFASKSSAGIRPLFTPQPSTMTDSAPDHRRRNFGSSTLSSYRSGLPSHLTSFNHGRLPVTAPRTPNLAPRIATSRSKKPWGTPINIKDYNNDYDLVAEPTSPSPAAKRKFSEIDDNTVRESPDAKSSRNDWLDAEREAQDWDDECEGDWVSDEDEDDGESVTFILDAREP